MKYIDLEEKYIFEYIRDILIGSRLEKLQIKDDGYHHNSSYKDAPSIVKNGILSMQEMNNLNIKKYSDEELDLYDDIESHINGKDGISLSKVGLTDLYNDEDEYNPFCGDCVDFLVSNRVNASRHTEHYGNEFIAKGKIDKKEIKSIDIRLIEYTDKIYRQKSVIRNIENIDSLIAKYNQVKNIAIALKENGNYIPFRETSENKDFVMDVDKLASNPKIRIKK